MGVSNTQGGVSYTGFENLSEELNALVYPPLYDPASTTCYLFRHPATLATHRYINQLECYIPLETIQGDNTTWYYGTFFGTRASSTMVKSISDLCLAKIALCVPHTSLSKSGTWVTSPGSIATGAYTTAGAAYSSTAGDTISGSVTGSIIGLQTYMTTVNGYGIVSIDGDYTRATRLPLFTAADEAAGRCRASDVGKRYFCSYATTQVNEWICLADDLTYGSHTIVVEVTGTKPAAASSTRCYIERFYGVTTGQTPGSAEVYFVPVYWIKHLTNISAQCYVPQWAPSGSSNYQFLGENHSDNSTQSLETEVSWEIRVNGVDQTAIATGAFVSGSAIVIKHSTTLAHADSLVTPVMTKDRIYSMMAGRQHPLMVDISITYNAAGTMQIEYPGMLTIGDYTCRDVIMVKQEEFTTFDIVGNEVPVPTGNTGTVTTYKGINKTLRAFGPRLEGWVQLIESSPNYELYTSSNGSLQDSTTLNQDKVYLITDNKTTYINSGTVRRFVLGYGARKIY